MAIPFFKKILEDLAVIAQARYCAPSVVHEQMTDDIQTYTLKVTLYETGVVCSSSNEKCRFVYGKKESYGSGWCDLEGCSTTAFVLKLCKIAKMIVSALSLFPYGISGCVRFAAEIHLIMADDTMNNVLLYIPRCLYWRFLNSSPPMEILHYLNKVTLTKRGAFGVAQHCYVLRAFNHFIEQYILSGSLKCVKLAKVSSSAANLEIDCSQADDVDTIYAFLCETFVKFFKGYTYVDKIHLYALMKVMGVDGNVSHLALHLQDSYNPWSIVTGTPTTSQGIDLAKKLNLMTMELIATHARDNEAIMSIIDDHNEQFNNMRRLYPCDAQGPANATQPSEVQILTMLLGREQHMSLGGRLRGHTRPAQPSAFTQTTTHINKVEEKADVTLAPPPPAIIHEVSLAPAITTTSSSATTAPMLSKRKQKAMSILIEESARFTQGCVPRTRKKKKMLYTM